MSKANFDIDVVNTHSLYSGVDPVNYIKPKKEN